MSNTRSGDSLPDEADLLTPDDQLYAELEGQRRGAEADLDVPIVKALRDLRAAPWCRFG